MNATDDVAADLLRFARQQQEKGNKSITPEKLAQLQQLLADPSSSKPAPTRPHNKPVVAVSPPKGYTTEFYQRRSSTPPQPRYKPSASGSYTPYQKLRLLPKPPPAYSPLLTKYKAKSAATTPVHIGRPPKQDLAFLDLLQLFSFRKLERLFVAVLEAVGNILDNLHLFAKLPMFPEVLTKLLKNTNKIWVLILVFLIRKTITQLRNVLRKERKVQVEMRLLENHKTQTMPAMNDDVRRKYEKVLKDLRFDKMMLWIELLGNFLDLAFNVIELYQWAIPKWAMNTLNVASMAMTIYRMNKDDEYLDDDITEDLI